MAKNTYVAILLCVLFLNLVSFALDSSGTVAYSAHGRGPRLPRPQNFQKAWQVHGDREAFATLRSYELEFVRIAWSSRTEFFERQARLSVNGESFVRQLIDPQATKLQYAALDRNGRFHEEVNTLDANGAKVSRRLSAGDDRVQGVNFSVVICSLIPILQKCAQPNTKIDFLERTPQMLDKFKVATPDGEFVVYTDRFSLIRRVDICRLALQFADYRTVNGLKLPYLQRVLLGDRLIYEFNFTKIDLKPTFPADFFDGINRAKWPPY